MNKGKKQNLEPEIIIDLKEINRRLSYDLWNVSFFGEETSGLSPRLIFPQKRKKNKDDESIKRISEQEARILYCNILNNLNYFYSIETPTKETYQLTGNTSLSALSDLSIYRYVNGSFDKKANVEFKALNPTTSNFSKDIEKLIKENIEGNWFHILKNIDSGTLPSIFNKFITSFIDYKYKRSEKCILFCFCILEKKLSIIKKYFYKPSLNKKIKDDIENFFSMSKINISNNIKDKNLQEQKDILINNGWTIIEH